MADSSFMGRFPRELARTHLLCGRPAAQALQNAIGGLAAHLQSLPVCAIVRQRHCPPTRLAGVCCHSKLLGRGDAQSNTPPLSAPSCRA